MNRYTESDELLNLQIRLRYDTLPIAPPAPVVELPDGSHEMTAPRDWATWQPTEPLPLVTVTARTPRRYLALAACIVPLLAVAGDVAGRWFA